MLPKDLLDGIEFGDVPEGSGGAVCVDMLNISRLNAGIEHSQLHDICGALALGVGGRHVVGIGCLSCSDEFGIDMRSPCDGMVILLKHECDGSFADHESVARGTEGP